ncbi:kinetochore-associated protein DSN1 homolog [Calypte anna]|uniref:kinetochore-associated protein DSN1 homolog n=1 Tax=Calypte anna TaxID=9244 RepID=UPI0011C449A5|nr:kinetochore-associated protein DSN1 homolog [Calypte anna]
MAEPPVRGGGDGEGKTTGQELPPALQPPSEGSEKECSPDGSHPAAAGVAAPHQHPNPHDVTKKTPGTRKTPRAALRKKSQQRTPSQRKNPLGSSPTRLSPWKSSPRNDPTWSSFSLSPQLSSGSSRKRRSWRRSSLKGTKRRKSLPPVQQDASELSKSISLDLPETERLSALLLSSFQFSAQKLEQNLKLTQGFNPEVFRAKAQGAEQELQRILEKLGRDGTLERCVRDPRGTSLDSSLEDSVAQVKELISRFGAECHAWDQLLQHYQENAEEMARRLEQSQQDPQPLCHLQSSQSSVLCTKPNYQQILEEQGEVWSSMELLLDELQQAVRVLQSFSEDSEGFLRRLSEKLASRTFQPLENSPVRKLLAAPPPRTLLEG